MVEHPLPTLLDRHQIRREQGIPTVTVLVGPPGLGVQAWRNWAGRRGLSVAHVLWGDRSDLTIAWVSRAFEENNPVTMAIRWVASQTHSDPAVTAARIERMTRYDFDTFWRELPSDATDPTAAAAYYLLMRFVTGERIDIAAMVGVLAETSAGVADPVRVFRAIGGLLTQSRWPALLISPPHSEAAGWLLIALRGLEQIVATLPTLPVAVAVAAEEYDRTVADQPTIRSVALAREGYAAVPAVSVHDLSQRLRAAGVVPPPPDATLRRLTADGLSEEMTAAFVEAAVAARSAVVSKDDSQARSAAERLLHERLESLPQTAGLFALNQRLPFAHGIRSAEADLCASRLKLVVEVDGSYYHLKTHQYRLDRRKDWLYQRHGYWILRFLAEDVIDDLNTVLDAILEAVALRSNSTPYLESARD